MTTQETIIGLGLAGLAVFALRPKKKARGAATPGMDGSTVWDGMTPIPAWLKKTPTRTGPGPQRSPDVLGEICRQWKVGNEKAAWTPSHYAAVNGAVDASLVALARPWDTIPEAKELAFEVTRDAIFSLCPKVPLPSNREVVDQLRAEHFWLDELWTRIYAAAWNRITGQG